MLGASASGSCSEDTLDMTLENAVEQISSWETILTTEFGARFHIMNRTRVDLSSTLTLLGCTLWTHVPPSHQEEVAVALKDLDQKHGIWDRSVLDHNTDHANDLSWLNESVSVIESLEPEREILMLTHHSPTIDARANSKRFPPERALNSAFRTDLSGEKCWRSPAVKVWAYGHTHFSCQFVESGDVEGRRKLVVSNQKGYASELGKGNWGLKPMVVGRVEGMWKVVVGAKETSEQVGEETNEKIKTSAGAKLSEVVS